ncbi:hypothetical protein VE00_06313 [Pseudogymnoascus sp. WSF 3629]|nr:hypothetical protein VE00_06313 [Pseudogymnoascus sp. WSF 3629]
MATPPDPPSRRTLTPTESPQFRRPRLASLPESPPPPRPPRPHSPRSPSPLSDHPAPRRRSSLISIDSLSSLSSARRALHSDSASLLHPPPVDAHDGLSAWHSLPLAFALLPALGGLVFKDGSRVVSDVLLLGLAAVFLNWSVRLPWDWYRSAQEIRTTSSPSGAPLIPPTKSDTPRSPAHAREIATYTSATTELRTHELLALLSCVVFPLLSAGLLHVLRRSLRAGASGLVSDFNLVVFMLAAEIRPVGQLLRLVRARTLWLQRVVKIDPRTGIDERQDGEIESLRRRVDALEQQQLQGAAAGGEGEEEVLARVRDEVRRATREEVEALSRAVRRYERRAGVLAGRVEGRLGEESTLMILQSAPDARSKRSLLLLSRGVKVEMSRRGAGMGESASETAKERARGAGEEGGEGELHLRGLGGFLGTN